MKCYGGEVMLLASHQMVGQCLDDGFDGACPEPVECRRNDFFGIPMEFGDKRRQKSEGMATARTKEAPNGNRIRFCKRDKIAHVAPMPPQASSLLASLAMAGL